MNKLSLAISHCESGQFFILVQFCTRFSGGLFPPGIRRAMHQAGESEKSEKEIRECVCVGGAFTLQ